MRLGDFKAMTFDCYGTLIDWESGIVQGLQPLVEKTGRTLTRDEILEAHARHESAQQKQTPGKRYSALLAVVYRRLAEDWGAVVDWDECLAYGGTVKDWPTFADSADSLAYLKQHYKLVILSNVDNASFAQSSAKLGVDFDAVYTAQDIGSYKPADRNFEYMLRHLAGIGVARDAILHTAESLFHDHEPAKRHGLASCRIFRRRGQTGYGAAMAPASTPDYAFCFDSMADFVAAHRQESAELI